MVAAVAQVGSQPLELWHATGAAKKKKKERERERISQKQSHPDSLFSLGITVPSSLPMGTDTCSLFLLMEEECSMEWTDTDSLFII